MNAVTSVNQTKTEVHTAISNLKTQLRINANIQEFKASPNFPKTVERQQIYVQEKWDRRTALEKDADYPFILAFLRELYNNVFGFYPKED